MGLEVVAHGRSTVGSNLYDGEVADAITATQVCGGEAVRGPRFATVSRGRAPGAIGQGQGLATVSGLSLPSRA